MVTRGVKTLSSHLPLSVKIIHVASLECPRRDITYLLLQLAMNKCINYAGQRAHAVKNTILLVVMLLWL